MQHCNLTNLPENYQMKYDSSLSLSFFFLGVFWFFFKLVFISFSRIYCPFLSSFLSSVCRSHEGSMFLVCLSSSIQILLLSRPFLASTILRGRRSSWADRWLCPGQNVWSFHSSNQLSFSWHCCSLIIGVLDIVHCIGKKSRVKYRMVILRRWRSCGPIAGWVWLQSWWRKHVSRQFTLLHHRSLLEACIPCIDTQCIICHNMTFLRCFPFILIVIFFIPQEMFLGTPIILGEKEWNNNVFCVKTLILMDIV